MKIFSAIEHPQVKTNLNSKKRKQPSQPTVSQRLKTKRSIDRCSFPKTYASTGFLSEKISCKSIVNSKKTKFFLLQNLRFHAHAATRIVMDARVNQKSGCFRKDALQPAEPVKNAVSLILVHHPKSDFNRPFIIESASTHLLCVDAVSTAKPDKGGF